MSINFQWHASSISGSKKLKNEDSWAIFSAGSNDSENLSPTGNFNNEQQDIIFAISDGMGGGNAGHLASKLILEHIANIIPQTFRAEAQGLYPNHLEQLELAIENIHHTINQTAEATPAHKGMGATLSLAWFTPENLYIAHIGDSRIYLHRDLTTTQLTLDHTLVWKKLQRAEITEMQYRSHPRRSVLFQVIGAGHRNAKPQITSIPYQKGDKFMLCSDGIIDGTWQKNIHSAFLNEDSPSKTHDTILNQAIENAGTDDTTIITLQLS